MKTEIITSVAEFVTIRDEWNRLSGAEPLLRHEWFYSWWKHFGRHHRLAIVLVRDENAIRAIAPWYLAHDPLLGRVVRFLGSGKACTDYQRILADPACASEAVPLLAEYVCCSHPSAPFVNVDRIELEGVRSAEPTIELLVEHLQRHGYFVQRDPLESSWATDPHTDFDAYQTTLPKRMRRKLSRMTRRIAQTPHLRFLHTAGSEEFNRKWPVLVELHQKRFSESKGLDGCFACADFTAFLQDAGRQLAATDRATIHWAELDGRPIVVQLHLRGPQVAYMYQSGFDPAYAALEPGFLLYAHFLREHFTSDSPQSLDFLRGNEKYKSMWNAREIPLWRIHCIAPRWTSRLRQQAYMAGRMLKRLAQARPTVPPVHAG